MSVPSTLRRSCLGGQCASTVGHSCGTTSSTSNRCAASSTARARRRRRASDTRSTSAAAHFKTYTEETPLFGKRVGTYWWDAQVRGKAEESVVEKDYRVRLEPGLGREYIPADEHSEIRSGARGAHWARPRSRRARASGTQHHPEPPCFGSRRRWLPTAPSEAGRAAVRPRLGGERGRLGCGGQEHHDAERERQLRLAVGQSSATGSCSRPRAEPFAR
jgi:hypothetical protein